MTRTEKKKIIWVLIPLVIVLISAAVLVTLYRVINKPESLFVLSQSGQSEQVEAGIKQVESILDTPAPVAAADEGQPPAHSSQSDSAEAAEAVAAETAVSDSGSQSSDTQSEADAEPESKSILNLMIFGIDAYESGGTSSGTEPHTDANVLVTINFDENRVDLTSILRDTFTSVPGYEGFYKFNSVFNVGGGLKDVDSGLSLSCRTAEMWMGGIQIDYYYGLDFKAVVDIVNAIGGIDFDVDRPIWDGSKWIGYGMHHLNGDEVMSYIRMRTTDDGLDSSRASRQRRMLVAIFNKLRNEGKLSMIPQLIHSANSGIYTNTNITQTTALANYALKLDPDNIYIHSLVSDLEYNYEWVFNFVDDDARIALIKELYGIDAEPMGYTAQYEHFLKGGGLRAMKYYKQAEKLISWVNEQAADGLQLTEEQQELYRKCYEAYDALYKRFNEASDWMRANYRYDRYDSEQSTVYNEYMSSLRALEEGMPNLVRELAGSVGCTLYFEWTENYVWCTDRDINPIFVDFG